jgi:hypothetical protein
MAAPAGKNHVLRETGTMIANGRRLILAGMALSWYGART